MPLSASLAWLISSSCHLIAHHLLHILSLDLSLLIILPHGLQVKMRDLLVRVGRYPCGSLDVEVSSSGLAIADRRHAPHMPHHLSIITITPDQPDARENTKDVFAPWDTLRGFVATNVFMPDFSRLAHKSSFERRHSIRRAPSTLSSLLSHRQSGPDRCLWEDRPDRLGWSDKQGEASEACYNPCLISCHHVFSMIIWSVLHHVINFLSFWNTQSLPLCGTRNQPC